MFDFTKIRASACSAKGWLGTGGVVKIGPIEMLGFLVCFGKAAKPGRPRFDTLTMPNLLHAGRTLLPELRPPPGARPSANPTSLSALKKYRRKTRGLQSLCTNQN